MMEQILREGSKWFSPGVVDRFTVFGGYIEN
jgi:hypothetical protein